MNTAPLRPTRRLAVVALVVAQLAVAGVLGWSPAASAWEDNVSDAELMDQALWSCRGLSKRRRKKIDLGLFRAMLDLERRMGVPERLRGMTLAKACIESGYTPTVKGDCRPDGTCKALGIIQLWPWTQRFGVDRTDPIDSVRFLLTRVQIGMTTVQDRCPRVRGDIGRFVMAWLRINRGPLQGGRQRCHGTPHGLRRLRQWHRNIAKTRRLRARAERRAPKQVDTDWGYNASSAIWSTRPVRRNYAW